MNVLAKIIKYKKQKIKRDKHKMPLKSFISTITPSKQNFKKAIAKKTKKAPNLIAEIKQASPSGGIINPNLDDNLEKIIKIYNKYASAISVITDQKFFKGSIKRLTRVRTLTNLPILCKDFIIDEYQIYQARQAGANALLLITYNLKLKTLKHLIKTANKLKMDCLVEVHNHTEIKKALQAGADIIGINNRNLKTFEVDIQTTLKLAKHIPDDVVLVSESGFKTDDDIQHVADYADAILIGTTLMQVKNINQTLNKLML